ncbi:unnamed protein product [Sphenostylis stenocarpa]|uniref:Uncharacterized protein n=1 Tax=Sphenostylis stenocarpa TaxID=92480 RepID=A0AA86V9S9_9FABA|nr:unnamed protein product [Sphenostylis stenocarpa]
MSNEQMTRGGWRRFREKWESLTGVAECECVEQHSWVLSSVFLDKGLLFHSKGHNYTKITSNLKTLNGVMLVAKFYAIPWGYKSEMEIHGGF